MDTVQSVSHLSSGAQGPASPHCMELSQCFCLLLSVLHKVTVKKMHDKWLNVGSIHGLESPHRNRTIKELRGFLLPYVVCASEIFLQAQ